MDATLNVRMSAALKERGDKVLRENGMSTSAAVRGLWQEMAETRKLPAFLERIAQDDSAKQGKIAALESLAGVAQGLLSDITDEELNKVGMARYE